MNGKLDAAERSRLGIEPEFRPWDEERDGPIPKPGEILEAGGREAKELESDPFEEFSAPFDFGSGALTASLETPPIPLSDLPCWKGYRGGMGPAFDSAMAGGIRPSTFVLIGAASAQGGKTAFLQQIIEGLALRSAQLVNQGSSIPLTPVLVISEMTAEALMERSISRWDAVSQSIVVNSIDERRPSFQARIDLARKDLAPMGHFMRYGRIGAGPVSRLIGVLKSVVEVWRSKLESQHGRAVVPVIAIDPIQRFMDPTRNAIEAIGELGNALRELCQEQRLIVFATSDTNRASATKEDDGSESPASLIRGSYDLQHQPDIIMVLRNIRGRSLVASGARVTNAGPGEFPPDAVKVDLSKNRRGQRWPSPAGSIWFAYQGAFGRFWQVGEGAFTFTKDEPEQSSRTPSGKAGKSPRKTRRDPAEGIETE